MIGAFMQDRNNKRSIVMNQLLWKKIFLNGTENGQKEFQKSCTDVDTVAFRYLPLSNGYACYVSATCAEGFVGEDSIILQPKIAETSEYVAIQNHSPFWCSPFFGKRLSGLPKRVQELIIRNGDKYICYLPVCDATFKTLIRGCEGGFEFFLYSNYDGLVRCEDQLAFVCMEGEDPLVLARDCAQVVAELLGNGLALRETKKATDVFNYLGWCSWNAFMIHVDQKGLLEKAKEFREKGVPIRWAIIDDMWANVPPLDQIPKGGDFGQMIETMHQSKLYHFEGSPGRFPNGMRGAITELKQAGIPQVGVWFPTTGYWAGLDPEGEEAKRHAENVVITEQATFLKDQRSVAVAPNEEKASHFFDDLCGRVKEWGGDFVKIDNQGDHHSYRNITPIGQSARAIQRAIDRATNKYFDGALINCMGMPSECMFNRTSTVSRCSDDFVPESREWFAKNILQCSYNGLLQGQYYVNDWDMWWTDDDQAAKNSLCRAISGGPVYVSDMLGRTKPEIFEPLILSDGRIIRCDESATPTADCIIDDPTQSGKIFKIRNRIGKNGLAAVFNIDAQNRPVSGTLAPAQTGIAKGDYVYYEYFSGECGVLKDGESLSVTLQHNDDFRLYTFVPYNQNGVTVLGRLDLFTGVGAVKSWDGEIATLVEGGKIGFYSEQEIKIYANGTEAPACKYGKLSIVCVETQQKQLQVMT